MIRVFHLITGLNTGGAEMMLAKLTGAMDKSRFPTRVATLLPPGPLTPLVQQNGVPVASLGMGRNVPLSALTGLPRLVALMREAKPDVVQTWLYHADLVGLIAAKLAGVKRVVWNIRCSDMDFSSSGRFTRKVVELNARLSRRPAAVIANSSIAVDIHRELGYAPKRFEVIPNGFDLERFAPDPSAGALLRRELDIPDDAPLLGMVARYDPQKDHANLFHAASELMAVRPDAHFVLCGDGLDAANTEVVGMADAAGIGPNLHLLGRREDVPRIMAALDVGVLSSAYGEGFPNVVGEAMACGVPCVATNTGDTAQVVGDTGVVVPPRDPKALAEGMLSLLSQSRGGLAELGAAARKRIESNYSLPAIADRYQSLYESLM